MPKNKAKTENDDAESTKSESDVMLNVFATPEDVCNFVAQVKAQSKHKWTMKSINFNDIVVNGKSGADVKRAYRKLRATSLSKLALGTELDILEQFAFNHLNNFRDKRSVASRPDMPKRPRNAFNIFCAHFRKKMAKKHPGIKIQKDAMVIMGDTWRSLSAEKKSSYEEKAKQEKLEYQTQLASFYKRHPELEPVDAKKKPKQCSTVLPKTALDLYVSDAENRKRAFERGYNKNNIRKVLVKEFLTLPEKRRDELEKRSNEIMKEWLASNQGGKQQHNGGSEISRKTALTVPDVFSSDDDDEKSLSSHEEFASTSSPQKSSHRSDDRILGAPVAEKKKKKKHEEDASDKTHEMDISNSSFINLQASSSPKKKKKKKSHRADD